MAWPCYPRWRYDHQSGTGVVMLQSLPFSRLADRIIQHAPMAGGSRQGEGTSALKIGGAILGGLMDRD